MFDGHYQNWRDRRVDKLIEIMGGSSWFAGKKVLELGAGHGHVSMKLAELGAVATAAEGRIEHVETMRQQLVGVNVVHLDQRMGYDIGTYDLVVHWGVLYHLPLWRWKEDIHDAARHAPVMCLETEVCDSDDPDFALEVLEPDSYDQSMEGMGVRPSAAAVERAVLSAGMIPERYDDENIGTDVHRYNWTVSGTNGWEHGMRRFWMCRRTKC